MVFLGSFLGSIVGIFGCLLVIYLLEKKQKKGKFKVKDFTKN